MFKTKETQSHIQTSKSFLWTTLHKAYACWAKNALYCKLKSTKNTLS